MSGLLNVISSRTQPVKFLNMSNDDISAYYTAKTLDEVLPTLDTGDILLFRGMGQISGAIKKLTLCNFSHTGMVVRNPSKAVRDAYHVPDSETDPVFCWEANMSTHPPRPGGGTHLPTLRWKFERALVRECEEYVLCVRRLVLDNERDKIFPNLEPFMIEMSTRSYEMERSELLGGLSGLGRVTHIENLKSVFCSELIAAAYKRMGLLKLKVNPSVFVPRTFTSDQRLDGTDLKLIGAKLEREVRIISEKSIAELKSNPIYTDTPTVEAGNATNQFLVVSVVSADIPGKETLKPFITVQYREAKFKTKKKSSAVNLIWNEQFEIPLTSTWQNNVPHVDNFVSFSIFSKTSAIGNPDFVGRAYIDITKTSFPMSLSLPINSGGSLAVQFTLKG